MDKNGRHLATYAEATFVSQSAAYPMISCLEQAGAYSDSFENR